jgi:hypothetical protein
MPGSWDVPAKKWLVGAGLAAVLAWHGVGDLITAVCEVPVPRGRFNGMKWMPLEGAGARWFGVCLLACALGLNARFFWRFHRDWWRHYEAVQGFCIGLAAVSIVVTYGYLWQKHY